MKCFFRLAGILFVLLLIYAAWIKIRSLDFHDGGPDLAVRWEGFYHDMNYRDIGVSANQCLGQEVFKEGILFRSAGWFSGWSCAKVGHPQVIYSLNYSPQKEERYFCQEEQEKIIGRYFNPDIKLNNLEYLRSWSDSKTRLATCSFLKDIFMSVMKEQRVLLHCDAGRDRTGTITALLVAMAAEKADLLNSEMLDAIECDYRKTESLDPEKYGRMADFIQSLKGRGGIQSFISKNCNIDPGIFPQVTSKMLN
jgi:protein-tyrosine phosphatase family protein